MEEEGYGLGTQVAAEMLTGLVDELPDASKDPYVCPTAAYL